MYPELSASAFLLIAILFPIVRIIIIFDPKFYLIFIEKKLYAYKIIYYIISIFIGIVIYLYFVNKKRFLEIEEYYKNEKTKNKVLTDLLLVIYFILIIFSYFLPRIIS